MWEWPPKLCIECHNSVLAKITWVSYIEIGQMQTRQNSLLSSRRGTLRSRATLSTKETFFKFLVQTDCWFLSSLQKQIPRVQGNCWSLHEARFGMICSLIIRVLPKLKIHCYLKTKLIWIMQKSPGGSFHEHQGRGGAAGAPESWLLLYLASKQKLDPSIYQLGIRVWKSIPIFIQELENLYLLLYLMAEIAIHPYT